MANQKAREEFLSRLVQETGRSDLPNVLRLGRLIMRHAATHGRLQEEKCGREWSAADERKEDLIERRILDLYYELFPEGKGILFGGDPRGFTVKIIFPSGVYNTWGGSESGYGVPQ